MKSVCIVGAGPAGLAAAKTFLQTKRFDVTVYEKDSRIGGIWALDEDSKDGFLSPHTPTNLSRFTVGFSDLDWNSVDLRSKRALNDGLPNGTKMQAPMFPKAWQVNRYLETYKQKYIPDGIVFLNHDVIEARRIKSTATSSSVKWAVTTKDGDNKITEERTFDYLVVASGFFAQPRALTKTVASLPENRAIKPIHSSEFRDLDDLFADQNDVSGKAILLIGGGNSAGEAGAAVAMQLSDAQWSSDQTRQKRFEGCKVIHILPRPLYALPPFNEYEKDSQLYVPLDFRLYDFSKRPANVEAYGGHQPNEVRDIVHGALQAMVGSDQSDLGAPALVSPKDNTKGAVYVALSETYPEFVRSGLIGTIAGRVSGIKSNNGETSAVVLHNDKTTAELSGIGGIIYATGYTPIPALDFLEDGVKNDIQYDPDSMRLPIVLEQWQTMNSSVPELAFLGFYEGPYWPMVEMQARLTAGRWLKGTRGGSTPFERKETLLHLRNQMRDRDSGVPQYWFGDYLGYMENVASTLSLTRNDGEFGEREGCPSPARYLSEQSDKIEAAAIMKDLHQVWTECTTSGRFVARAAFRALQGKWAITRKIVSSDKTFSGTLSGTASFQPRFPTDKDSSQSFDFEYLYVESGEFVSAQGFRMTASRRYVYRYAEATDTMSIWFVKPDQRALDVDYLFHNLTFVSPVESKKAGACVAKADHLCVDDMYWTEYRFPLKGILLLDFQIKHTVRGPAKDYVATTEYQREP